jgi:hypothetical protein
VDIAEASSKAEFQSRNVSSTLSPESTKVELSSRLIERLFARFAAVYGAKFANAWAGADPDEMKRAWSERLCRFDPNQVGKALEICENSVKFPPTLPEFIELVRSCHFVDGLVALEHKLPPPKARSDAELTASREYPKDGFGVFWACQIVRLEQLGAYGYVGPLMSAMKVLGLTHIDELAAKYPPHIDEERAALQSEGV